MAIGVGISGPGSGVGTASLSVSVDDSTPDWGDSITITITPTSVTPTSYIFWTPNEDGSYTRTEQAGNTLAWTVIGTGAQTIYGSADDGTDTAYDIDGIAITIGYDFNNGIDFDGSNWAVTTDMTIANLILAGTVWQASLWFDANSFANAPGVISLTTGSGFMVEVDATHIYVFVGSSSRHYTVSTMATAARHHVLVQKTGNGNNLKVYLDGVEQTSYTGSTGDLANIPYGLYLGRYSSGGFEFNGSIKDVCFYQGFNSSAGQISTYYNSGNGSHPSILGQHPDWWIDCNSRVTDQARLGADCSEINSPTYSAF